MSATSIIEKSALRWGKVRVAFRFQKGKGFCNLESVVDTLIKFHVRRNWAVLLKDQRSRPQ